ncbi:MAG: hypothetical protein ACFE95_04430 [Candidatus Hodarchaeota archaeon]
MFCEICGTVLNAQQQCINCTKKEPELKVSTHNQETASSKIIGR